MNSFWVAHAVSENHCKTTKSLKICYFFSINQEQVYRTKISDVDELKRRIVSEWAAVSLMVIEPMNVLLASGVSVYALAFVLEEDILSTHCNKDDVTDGTRVTFLRDNNCQSCLSLIIYHNQLSIQMYTQLLC